MLTLSSRMRAAQLKRRKARDRARRVAVVKEWAGIAVIAVMVLPMVGMLGIAGAAMAAKIGAGL